MRATSGIGLLLFCALVGCVVAQDLLVSSLNKYRSVSSDDGTATTVDLSEGPASVGSIALAPSNMGVPGINRQDHTLWMSFTNDHKVFRTTGGSLADGLEMEHVLGGDAPGSTDGVGTNALFDTPTMVAGALDGTMYVLDSGNNAVRKVDTDLTVTTLLGGTSENFDSMEPLAFTVEYVDLAKDEAMSFEYVGGALLADTRNDLLYVADASTIRKVDVETETCTTIVGTALAANALPVALDIEGVGTNVDAANVTALALDIADPTATSLFFASPYYVGVVDTATEEVSVIAGHVNHKGSSVTDGTGTDAVFFNIVGMTLNKDGDLVVVDQCQEGNVIRKVTTSGAVSALSGNYNTAGCILTVADSLPEDAVAEEKEAVDTRDSVTTIGDKDGDATTSTFRMEGRGVLAVQHLCDQFFPIGVTVEADLSGCTSTIGGNIFELNVDSNTEVTIAEVTIVQNGVTVSNGSTVAVQGTSLTVQGLLSILDGATFSVDNGDVVVDSLDIVDGLSTYKLVVSKNSPNVISVLNNANLNGRLVICITYDYSFGVGHKFNALNFDTFAGQFSEILFVKLLARRAASRSLLEAAGVDVTCSSTDKACVATGVDAEDDDELVPYIAAIIVLGVLIAGVVVGTVMYAAKKKSDGNVAEMANAPAYGYDSSSYFGADVSSSSSTYSF